MQSILLGTSQRSFTCENTVWIQPLAACTKPQGESTLKWCKVHRLDKNPQNQTHGAAFRLAELADPLTPSRLSRYGRREPCPRANANRAQCSHRAPGTLGRMLRHKPLIKRLSGKGKYDLVHEEGRKKVIDALEVSVWCTRRAYSFSNFTVKSPFVFQSYI